MIESYSFGQIIIDGKKYNSDLIIYKNDINSNWWRKEGHNLYIEDVQDIINKKPNNSGNRLLWFNESEYRVNKIFRVKRY